jgi:hypothetical protein
MRQPLHIQSPPSLNLWFLLSRGIWSPHSQHQNSCSTGTGERIVAAQVKTAVARVLCAVLLSTKWDSFLNFLHDQQQHDHLSSPEFKHQLYDSKHSYGQTGQWPSGHLRSVTRNQNQ